MDLVLFLDLIRIISIMVVVVCQVVIAHSLYVFSRHNVVAFSTGQLAMLVSTSAVMMALFAVLLIVKLAIL